MKMAKIKMSLLANFFAVVTFAATSASAGGMVSAGPVNFRTEHLCFAESIDPTYSTETSYVAIGKEDGLQEPTVIFLNHVMEVLKFIPAVFSAAPSDSPSLVWNLTLVSSSLEKNGLVYKNLGSVQIESSGTGTLKSYNSQTIEELKLFNCAPYAYSGL